MLWKEVVGGIQIPAATGVLPALKLKHLGHTLGAQNCHVPDDDDERELWAEQMSPGSKLEDDKKQAVEKVMYARHARWGPGVGNTSGPRARDQVVVGCS